MLHFWKNARFSSTRISFIACIKQIFFLANLSIFEKSQRVNSNEDPPTNWPHGRDKSLAKGIVSAACGARARDYSHSLRHCRPKQWWTEQKRVHWMNRSNTEPNAYHQFYAFISQSVSSRDAYFSCSLFRSPVFPFGRIMWFVWQRPHYSDPKSFIGMAQMGNACRLCLLLLLCYFQVKHSFGIVRCCILKVGSSIYLHTHVCCCCCLFFSLPFPFHPNSYSSIYGLLLKCDF